MPKSLSTPIAIVGNGLAGQVMAVALAKHNMSSVLIGPVEPVHTGADHRTTAIMQDGIAFLDSLGLWDETALQAVPLQTMRLISDDNEIAFASAEIGLPQFGFNIANAVLKQRLAAAIAASPLIKTIDTVVTDIIFASAQAHIVCADTQTIDAQLVIGADGKHSVVRDKAGVSVTQTAIDQQALVCVVESDEPHDFTSTEWYHRGGPFTLVPMPDSVTGQSRMAVVYCDSAAQITELSSLPLTDLGFYVTDMSQSRFGNLRVQDTPQIWPITPQRSTTMIAPHVALVGEAAHVLPPVAAQGFNTSLRDVQALVDVLQQAAALGLSVGQLSVLQNYAAQRALDMRVRGQGVDLLNRLIRQDDKIGRTLHKWGFNALNRVTPLKRLIMQKALAPKREHAA
jgi:2-octaprenyl-6-methoxyphenol hydroxylase